MSKKAQSSTVTLSDEARVDMATYAALLERRWESRATKLRPLYIVGHMGIGKSQTVYQVAERLSKKLSVDVQTLCLSMHTMEAPDFNGLSYVMDGKTLFAHPHLLPSSGYGILFLDELNRAPKDLLQAALTLIENREINGHKLGDGWIIVCAGNPTAENSDVLYSVKELDPALKDRLTAYTLAPKASESVDYLAKKYGEDNNIIRWLKAEPNVVSLDGGAKTSPRSLEYLIRSLDVNKGMDMFTVMAGEIGTSATIQFQKFMTSPASISIERLLDMDDGVKQMMVDFHKARNEALKEGKVNDVSIVNQWIDMLYTHVQGLKDKSDAQQKHFSLKDHPELTKSLGLFLNQLEVFEWVSTFISRIGWLHIDKDSIQNDILVPLRDSVPGLREKLNKIYAESKRRDEKEAAARAAKEKAASTTK